MDDITAVSANLGLLSHVNVVADRDVTASLRGMRARSSTTRLASRRHHQNHFRVLNPHSNRINTAGHNTDQLIPKMEAEKIHGLAETVHPEVRAYINSLVSALGGAPDDDTAPYKLGFDALEVLRDLKKWLRFYDEKTNRMDVARCLADSNLIGNDLLHIIRLWTSDEASTRSKFRTRCALACIELMVPLTWSLERDKEQMTMNHYRHIPVLELAQLGYKRDIINYDGAKILNAAVRVALPSVAIPIGDRTPRDTGIIKLVLFFLRNVAMIDVPPHISYTDYESLISRSVTIDAFHFQDIFLFLLTLASNMGEDFRTEDVMVLEILFHLLKRIDPNKIFMSKTEVQKEETDELKAMLAKEKAMLRDQGTRAPTRHSRFGTMLWVKKSDGKMATVTGQDALLDSQARKRKMDSTKKFSAPRRPRKENMEAKDMGRPATLTQSAMNQLRGFVDEFLDSGFNPLFGHLRKSLEREAPYVLKHHRRQFFYLVAWFLEAERARQKAKGKDNKRTQDDVSSFNLVAAVLTQEMFVYMQRNLTFSFTDKEWPDLTACIRCFTQILLTVQEMTGTGIEEDEEIAENILNRIFYEEETHDLVSKIASSYKDQGFDYLDASTELVHHYLRILEGYSKQNVDLMVRSKRRVRKKKAAAAEPSVEGDGNPVPDEEDDSAAEDTVRAEKETRERKFDFTRFANRFVPQGVVDTFVAFAKYYRDLDENQLKRAHRYFYRVAFKQDMSVMLFRVDIIHMLYNMIKGPQPLDRSSPMYKEWQELVKQVIKKCVRKIEDRPALLIEMLFSKISASTFYLEYGYEKQTISANPKPGAELEFKHGLEDRKRQVSIVVSVMIDRGQMDHISWVKSQLGSAETERRAWESAELAMVHGVDDPASEEGQAAIPEEKEADAINVKPDNNDRKVAMFKNSHLRLLMKLVGFERFSPTLDETPDDVWIIPGTQTARKLKESLKFVGDAEFAPPSFDEGESAEDQLKRKSAAKNGGASSRAARKKAGFDDDGDGGIDGFLDDDDMEDLEGMFPVGGPTARQADEHAKPKRKRRLKKKSAKSSDEGEEEVVDAKTAERRRKRRERELEKARKVKSEMYVHDSDEEWDEEANKEFFRKEEELRMRMERAAGLARATEEEKEMRVVMGMAVDDDGEEDEAGKESGKKKDAVVVSDDDDSESGTGTGSDDGSSDEEVVVVAATKKKKKEQGKTKKAAFKPEPRARKRKSPVDRDDEDEDDESGTPAARNALLDDSDDYLLDSSAAAAKKRKTSSEPEGGSTFADEKGGAMDIDDDHDDEPAVAKQHARRQNVRSGFVVESSDEDE
ncbi:timeless-domain-containing protein [Zalerion maritima]|uniref:Topoisomerase 1-associated factor 1 n=1 Tax=Zalerion maritima TaxID=339359 RepID=A0AAD5RTN7_9PEZI|nr:timeless-domain-containing protein [Zalerion maritima]